MKSLGFLLANILFYLPFTSRSRLGFELSQIREIMRHEAWPECRQFTKRLPSGSDGLGGCLRDVYIHNRSVASASVCLLRFCLHNVNSRIFFFPGCKVGVCAQGPLNGVRS